MVELIMELCTEVKKTETAQSLSEANTALLNDMEETERLMRRLVLAKILIEVVVVVVSTIVIEMDSDLATVIEMDSDLATVIEMDSDLATVIGTMIGTMIGTVIGTMIETDIDVIGLLISRTGWAGETI
jgi:hypothetical protein